MNPVLDAAAQIDGSTSRVDRGPDIQLLTCSAEDLVVHKVFASRDKDWLDVEGIVDRQGTRLNRRLVEDELRPLLELKDAAQDMSRLAEILDRRPA